MPSRSGLSYDPSLMLLPSEQKPEHVIQEYVPALKEAKAHIEHLRKTKQLGWLDLPHDQEMVKRVMAVVSSTKSFDTLLVLGIGGSDLGARAILQALPSKRRVLFAGNNTDPSDLLATLDQIDWKKTVVNVISKSGDTVETMSAFMIVRERMKKVLGKKFAQHIVATTDPEEGTLAEWTRLEEYYHLFIQKNVGGRFSVFSDVGLFPAAWAGLNIKALLDGARSVVDAFERKKPQDFSPAIYATLHADGYLQRGRSIFVFMPYASRLEAFAFWVRQLLAESLGKGQNRSGLSLALGPTAIASVGAKDQHSQIQLYMDGPPDKLVTFLEIDHWDDDVTIPAGPAPSASLRGLAGRRLSEVIKAERLAIAEALAFEKRPNGTLFLPRLDEKELGSLFQWFMMATAFLGELLDINAYDQPGVEEGKKRLRTWLRF
ncbi:MAG: glucose-6-phosphate isomerase [bacterium]|nr:glucose-6-phosphate isomerase [bacterium]